MNASPPDINSRFQPLVVVVTAFAAGILLSRYAGSGLPASGFAVAWWATAALLGAWWWRWRGGRSSVSTGLLLLAAIAGTGAAWQDLRWNHFAGDELGRYAALEAQPACVTATVLTAPEVLPAPPATPFRAIPANERSRVEVQLIGIRDGAVWRSAGGRCQLVVDTDLLAVAPGDRVKVFGRLRRLRPPMNPGEFDFAASARAERRLASLLTDSAECVTIISASQGGTPWTIVESLRAHGQQVLRTYVGPRRAGLASAILLGIREELPYEETMPFFLSGTVHLLVVSGLNVAILAGGLYALVWIGWLPRRVALALVIGLVLAYALVAGGGPPVVRAAILVVLICLAAWFGRQSVGFNSLAAAALVALALNPAELFQTGTQLSFLSVAILISVGQLRWFDAPLDADPLDRLIAENQPWYRTAIQKVGRWTLLLMITSAAIWAAVLPLALYRFHLASPVALLIAPVVWILALAAMWAGFVTLACGYLVPMLAVSSGKACSVSLDALVAVVDWAQRLPGGHVWLPGPALWWVIGFYFGLVAVMLWGRPLLSIRWQIGLAAAWIVIGLVPPLVRPLVRDNLLHSTFVAMGHGTCVVIQTPAGQTFLYDAGTLGSPEFATQSAAAFLWDRGVLRIDGIILSHADVDHYNAVPGLLERFRVSAVYVSPMMFDWFGATGPNNAPAALREAIDAAAVPVREIWAGDRLRSGDVTMSVLHPPRDGVVGSDNANSVTLSVEYAGRRLMLPGDLETPGMEDVIAEEPIDCDVVMAPHHGSRRSDPPGFAAWSTPEWVVISGGADADSDVTRTYSDAGALMYNTGQLGAVEFTLSASGVDAVSYIPFNAQ